jgi:predicted nucleotidyltransferase
MDRSKNQKMISNEIRDALKQVATVLNRNQVDCMLIGDAAVGFYGHQRISGISLLQPEMKSDLDFWYRADNAHHEKFDGYEITVIGLNDLIANKLALGREIDKTDIDHLRKL